MLAQLSHEQPGSLQFKLRQKSKTGRNREGSRSTERPVGADHVRRLIKPIQQKPIQQTVPPAPAIFAIVGALAASLADLAVHLFACI